MADKGYGDIQNQGHQGLDTHAGTLDPRTVNPKPVAAEEISGLPKIPEKAVSLKK